MLRLQKHNNHNSDNGAIVIEVVMMMMMMIWNYHHHHHHHHPMGNIIIIIDVGVHFHHDNEKREREGRKEEGRVFGMRDIRINVILKVHFVFFLPTIISESMSTLDT